jgi:hypothetical protein
MRQWEGSIILYVIVNVVDNGLVAGIASFIFVIKFNVLISMVLQILEEPVIFNILNSILTALPSRRELG